MSENSINFIVNKVIKDREQAYSSASDLKVQLVKLIEYAILNRDGRTVQLSEVEASNLISNAITEIGYKIDINIGRDLWELVSEDSQAQWLSPPQDVEDVFISLVGVAENMAKNQCYIEFTKTTEK